MAGGEEQPVIVFVPFPAQGHVTAMMHLAAALREHGFRAVVAVPESIHRRLPAAAGDGEVVTVSVADGLPGGGAENLFAIEHAMEEIMPPALEKLIGSLAAAGDIAGVVVDLVASWAIDVAGRFSIPVAGFWPCMLAVRELFGSVPEMVGRGLISSAGIPLVGSDAVVFSGAGRPDMTAADLPWLVGDLLSQEGRFAFWQRAISRWARLRWLVVNTFPTEPAGAAGPCRVFRVAPLPPAAAAGKHGCSLWEEDRSCMSWLDSQARGSVVYVSFGSWIPPMAGDLLAELAGGLESSGHPFLWVLPDSWRANLASDFLDQLSPLSSSSSSSRGMVVRWAPQTEVLGHAAVGSFLTHCGWNSTMEAIRCRTPMLCYPVAADQFTNCRYIVEAWKVGVRLREIRREAVADGIAAVMGPGGAAALRRRADGFGEEMFGGGGRAAAAAELLAFVDELRNGKASSYCDDLQGEE